MVSSVPPAPATAERVALIWTDPTQGSGWSWSEVYRTMAWLMVGMAAFSLLALPRIAAVTGVRPVARHDVIGFLAVLLAVAVGYLLTQRFGFAIARALLAPWLTTSATDAALQARWVDLVTLLGIAFTLPLAAWAARKAHFETLLSGLSNYFAQAGATGFLVFIVLYKLGDAFAGSLMTPFLLQAMAFSSAEVGVVNKIIGLWLTIGGALLGGALMLKLGLWRALMLFGLLQMASNVGFWWLATVGKGQLPGSRSRRSIWGSVQLSKRRRWMAACCW